MFTSVPHVSAPPIASRNKRYEMMKAETDSGTKGSKKIVSWFRFHNTTNSKLTNKYIHLRSVIVSFKSENNINRLILNYQILISTISYRKKIFDRVYIVRVCMCLYMYVCIIYLKECCLNVGTFHVPYKARSILVFLISLTYHTSLEDKFYIICDQKR